MKCVSAGSASIPAWAGSARLLDLRNPFDILDLQVTAAFENFQCVFFVGEAQPLGFFDAKRDDAGRRVVPGGAMRRLPVEIIPDSAGGPIQVGARRRAADRDCGRRERGFPNSPGRPENA
jgi:hypothetical protein